MYLVAEQAEAEKVGGNMYATINITVSIRSAWRPRSTCRVDATEPTMRPRGRTRSAIIRG